MLGKLSESIADFRSGVKQARKKGQVEKSIARLLTDNRNTYHFNCKIADDQRFAYIPTLLRIYVKPQVFNEDGQNIIYTPEKDHGNARFENVKGIAEAQCYTTIIRCKDLNELTRTDFHYIDKKQFNDVKKELNDNEQPYVEIYSTGTIDWNLFDNDISPDFAADSDLVLQSEILSFLRKTSDWKLVVIGIAVFCLGAFFGFITATLFDIVFGMVLRSI